MSKSKNQLGNKARVTKRDSSYRGRIGIIYGELHLHTRLKFTDGTQNFFNSEEIEILEKE